MSRSRNPISCEDSTDSVGRPCRGEADPPRGCQGGTAMDLMMTDEQRRWHDAAVRFAEAELSADVAGRDECQEFWREGYRRCGKFGVLGLPIAAEYGGRGADLSTTAAAIEGLGYG